MKIGIVTVYDAVTNIGSYLQAYAMKTVLEQLGHEVVFIEKQSVWESVVACALRINPKRTFFLRIRKCMNYIAEVKAFCLLKQQLIEQSDLDLLLFGSDEIWNMENPYFRDPLFFGTNLQGIPKVAHAVSMGAIEEKTLLHYAAIASGICDFQSISVRDLRTQELVKQLTGRVYPVVCDPTMMIDKELLCKSCRLPPQKYLLVYSYGVDELLQIRIVEYARKHGLMVVSAFFWHIWCDKTIECRPLEFGYLIAHAECVFTSTFHGAVFTMLHHKRCCIYPVRSKVADVVQRFGVEKNLVENDVSQERFDETMDAAFPAERFELNLNESRKETWTRLKEALR